MTIKKRLTKLETYTEGSKPVTWADNEELIRALRRLEALEKQERDDHKTTDN